MEHPNERTKPMNEHLVEHELPNQGEEPMEEPKEARVGARSPSPEYEDPMEAEALMEEPRKPEPEPRAQVRSTWLPDPGARVRSLRRSRTKMSRERIGTGQYVSGILDHIPEF